MKEYTIKEQKDMIKTFAFYLASENHGRIDESVYKSMIASFESTLLNKKDKIK